mmetsp:Transcript_27509/g.69420  ORF Transcript_27509/g.69420 Transcript_27509/m.69420 type:complete len:272 (+) Transcript_27509:230-1045(+)
MIPQVFFWRLRVAAPAASSHMHGSSFSHSCSQACSAPHRWCGPLWKWSSLEQTLLHPLIWHVARHPCVSLQEQTWGAAPRSSQQSAVQPGAEHFLGHRWNPSQMCRSRGLSRPAASLTMTRPWKWSALQHVREHMGTEQGSWHASDSLLMHLWKVCLTLRDSQHICRHPLDPHLCGQGWMLPQLCSTFGQLLWKWSSSLHLLPHPSMAHVHRHPSSPARPHSCTCSTDRSPLHCWSHSAAEHVASHGCGSAQRCTQPGRMSWWWSGEQHVL